MADIKEELKRYLKTKSAITDLVGFGDAARIYKRKPRQGATQPFIIIARTGGTSFESLQGISGIATSAIMVWACDSDPDSAETLAEAIRLAPLQGFRGTMGATKVAGVTAPSDYLDGFEKSGDGDERPQYYWTARTYRITHAEATS